MKTLIRRRRPCRVARIENGGPWIDAVGRGSGGPIEHHSWMITEKTGWRLVRAKR
jgi:hypothetical protein